MRVAYIFKRLMGIDAVRISHVADEPSGWVITVTVERRRNRRMHCGRCGQRARSVYDRQVRSWRHLDAFRVRCVIRAEVRRVVCRDCGVCAEAVPWARPGSRVSRRSRTRACGWRDRRPSRWARI